jgi:hypothetical protein
MVDYLGKAIKILQRRSVEKFAAATGTRSLALLVAGHGSVALILGNVALHCR